MVSDKSCPQHYVIAFSQDTSYSLHCSNGKPYRAYHSIGMCSALDLTNLPFLLH